MTNQQYLLHSMRFRVFPLFAAALWAFCCFRNHQKYILASEVPVYIPLLLILGHWSNSDLEFFSLFVVSAENLELYAKLLNFCTSYRLLSPRGCDTGHNWEDGLSHLSFSWCHCILYVVSGALAIWDFFLMIQHFCLLEYLWKEITWPAAWNVLNKQLDSDE
jgi:hypothetical protein